MFSRYCQIFYISILVMSSSTPVMASDSAFQIKTDSNGVVVGQNVELTISLEKNSIPCAVEIRFGDNQNKLVRLEANSPGQRLLHSYDKSGTYAIQIEGKTQYRGLFTTLGCPGKLQEIQVSVINSSAIVSSKQVTSFSGTVSTPYGVATNQPTGRRVALVIGNSAYIGEKRLNNPVNDAELVGEALKKLNFEVSILRDASRLALLDGLEEFERQATGADAAFFYFSGHGVQDATRKNYLIPVDAQIKGETGIQAFGLEAGFFVDAIVRAAPRVGLVLLDACRNNPFPTRHKSANKGLARMDVQTNGDTEILIHFATRNGEVADDGLGSIGPYAQAVSKQLPLASRQSIRQLLDNIGDDVRRNTSGKQRPEQFGEMKTSSFLVPHDFSANEGNVIFPQVPTIGLDEVQWRSIIKSQQRKDYEFFLNQYPRSEYAELAKARISQLDEQTRLENIRGDQEAWSNAEISGSEFGYMHYLKFYSNGHFALQAKERLRLLRERTEATEALKRATELSNADNEAWQQAEKSGQTADYQVYLARYPMGQFSSAANARIRTLQDEARIRDRQAEIESQKRDATANNSAAEKQPGFLQKLFGGLSINIGTQQATDFPNNTSNFNQNNSDPLDGKKCPSGFQMINGKWVCMGR